MFVPNFGILGAVGPEKSLTQISLCIKLEWEMEKSKKVKRSQKKFQHYGFLLHKILQPSVGVYKMWRLSLLGAKKSVTKKIIRENENITNKRNDKHEDADSLFFIGEKEKWINKGNDKHEDADFVLHNTTSHTLCLYQVSKS